MVSIYFHTYIYIFVDLCYTPNALNAINCYIAIYGSLQYGVRELVCIFVIKEKEKKGNYWFK